MPQAKRDRSANVSLPLMLGAAFGLAASLSPSLVPRGPLVQGALSGISMAVVAGLARLKSVLRAGREARAKED